MIKNNFLKKIAKNALLTLFLIVGNHFTNGLKSIGKCDNPIDYNLL